MGDRNYCSDCQITFSTLNSFKNHVKKRHPTKEHQFFSLKKGDQSIQSVCKTCEETFSSSRAFNSHIKTFHKESIGDQSSIQMAPIVSDKPNMFEDETIGCSDCELEFDDLITFKQHMRDHRDNRIKKRDNISNKRNSKIINRNVKTKNKKDVNCHGDFSSKQNSDVMEEAQAPVRKSRRSRNIVSYASLIESGSESENESLAYKFFNKWKKSEQNHVCNECFMEYSDLNDLEKHTRKHHPSKLEKSIRNNDSLKKVVSSDKKYSCELCSTKSNNLSFLRTHIRKYHPAKWLELAPKLYKKRFDNSEKTFNCSECQTVYGNIVGLRKHIRKYHITKLNELAPALYKNKPRDTEKKVSCDECQMKYCTIISLRKHIKKEHPAKLPELMPMLYKKKLAHIERDISCSECNMRYSNKSGLRKHIRKHHPNKLLELAPFLYTFKRNMAKNILLKKRGNKELEIENFSDSELVDIMNKYKCNICENSYSNISNLRKHLRKFHPEKLSDVAPLVKDNTNYKYPCDLCSKRFNCIRNFKYHQRKCHPEIAQPLKRIHKHTKINKCPLCTFQNTERKKLLQHFEDDHKIEVSMTPVEVTTLEDFLKWKDSFEKETNTRFVKEYHFSCASHDVVSYICHRSGYYNPKGKGLRHMKAQGSSKINGYCPAAIKLKKIKDGSVKVTFCETHIGHTTDVSHLHLTATERQIIAEKIALNIPFNVILDSIKSSVSESDLKRIHMLSKKDLYNIKSSFHLTPQSAKPSKPPSENPTLEVWLEEMKKNEDCIMFHKPQGQYLTEHPDLLPDDFVLMIMNQIQQDKLRKFGSDTICIDRSFDLNSQRLELISLLVLNETQEGFPCAFLVTNRLDPEMLTLFFHYIKNNVGVIDSKVFMSDMVDYFYTTWSSVMSETHLRFYCTWQIEYAWKKKLMSLKSRDKQENIKAKLKLVLKENNLSSFKTMLESTVEQLRSETYTWNFANYLSEEYLQQDKLWSTHAGVYSDIKFNFHLERMHKTLKHLFLNGKNIKHLGKALGDIMRFIKDKLFDRTLLINRGKINNRMKIAIFRHKLSLHSKTDSITSTDAGWQIPSSENAEIYNIKEIQRSCRCEFICPECKSCIHRYLCSCLDSSVKWNMCKHIHLLCRYLNSVEQVHLEVQQNEQFSQEEQHEQQQIVYIKTSNIDYGQPSHQVEYAKQESQQLEFMEHTEDEYMKQHARQLEHIHVQQATEQIAFTKQARQISFVKQSPQMEHVEVQHIQMDGHVSHVDQVEGTYIYCNESNQREMDAILAEVNICNLETVQVTQIPTSCTIQIPTSCTVVPQVTQITTVCPTSFGESIDTKESLKMKFLKLLEQASSPSELEVVQKMLASITPTLEVMKGNSNQQVLFPL